METEEEKTKRLLGAFETLGAPPTDNPALLEQWMLEHLKAKGKVPQVKEEVKPVVEAKPVEFKSAYSPQLRISNFSGDLASKDTPFDLWIYEVRCLVRDREYSEATIQQAVRRSLKGEAARCVMRLTEKASLQEVVGKLEAVFGRVESSESLMAEFYSAHQKSDEDVATWGCRLEDILDRARYQGLLGSEQDLNKLLKNRFWSGLSQKLKDVSRHKYETVSEFDQLRLEMRVIENEYTSGSASEGDKLCKKVGQNKMVAAAAAATTESGGGDMKDLKGIIHKLSSQVERMEKQINQRSQDYGKPNGKPNSKSKDSSQDSGDSASSSGQAQKVSGDNSGGQGSGDSSRDTKVKCWNCHGLGHRKDVCPSKRVFECFFCHELGHRKFECPQNPDKDLNGNQPSSGGRRW